MPVPLQILILTTAAGICIPIGGLVATIARFRPQWMELEFRHAVIALGGGILLGAVSLVLIPEGLAHTGQSPWSVAWVVSGGLTFFWVERLLGLRRREAPQLMGMLLDFVPEAIALGGMFAGSSTSALLLALLIGMQNLPEGFNAYRELESIEGRGATTLLFMVALVPLGPIAGLSGFYFLADNTVALGAIMLFAGGGILYLIFQDIAPQSRLEKHWAPPLGAVIGFCIALIGEMLVQ